MAKELSVDILGPARVCGSARPLARSGTLDLVVYLTFHRHGASSDEWSEALWPGRLVSETTRCSVASAARRALGTASDGVDHLPRSRGRLRIRETVESDWDRFRQLASLADPTAWSEALGLIRGRPFQGVDRADWTLIEGHLGEIQERVTMTASRLTRHLLDEDRANEADWGLRRALLVNPFDEQIYRLRFEVADALGDRSSLLRCMDELTLALSDDFERPSLQRRRSICAHHQVHPATAALFHTLSATNGCAGTL